MPHDMKVIKGKTTEEQLRSVDRILHSFKGRLSQKVVGIIPPVPIIHSVALPGSDGKIFAGIIPFTGTLTTFCISIGKYAKKAGATIIITTQHKDGTGETKEILCKRLTQVFDTDLIVTTGDIFKVYEKDIGSTSDVLIGALIHPTLNATTKESQMLAQLLTLNEAEDASEQEEDEA